ncbi:MAG: pilus assembly FimT family protein [Haloferula sp.]
MTSPRVSFGNKHAGFSLIELIAVVSITVLLLAVGVSLFRTNRAEAVQTATEQVSALIEQGRTSAITRRKPVALVILRPGEGGFADDSCRVGLFELEAWQDDSPVEGRQLQRWNVLPTGVAFFGGELDELLNVLDQTAISLSWKDGLESGEFPGLVFSARGGLLAPVGSESVVLSMRSGTYQDGQAVEIAGGGKRGIRIGRVVARAWNLDV